MATTISDSATKKCAVVTGANKGIGLEICRQLASIGVMVVLTARDEKKGLQAVADLQGSGLSDVVFHQLDVTDANSIASLANFIQTQYGKLDILVNNAGVSGATVDWETFSTFKVVDDEDRAKIWSLFKGLTEETYEMAEECVKTNFYGTKGVTKALLPFLLQSSSGRIVNVSAGFGKLQLISNEKIKMELNDVEGLEIDRLEEIVNGFLHDFKEKRLEEKGWPSHVSAYAVSKAAVNAHTRVIAKLYTTLRVNCVCPGFVRTDITSNIGLFSVETGAKGPVMLALLPDTAPSGLFFDKTEVSTF